MAILIMAEILIVRSAIAGRNFPISLSALTAWRRYGSWPRRSTMMVASDLRSRPVNGCLGVHIAIGNLKAYLLGTFHGVSGRYLQKLLNEFVYRFNRRFREAEIPLRLLNACMDHRPIRLADETG